jgi:hypothetical protein
MNTKQIASIRKFKNNDQKRKRVRRKKKSVSGDRISGMILIY